MDQRYYEELRKLKILADSDKDARAKLKTELLELTDIEKAEFARKMKLDDELERPASNEFRGLRSQKGKVALVEYTNQSQDFLLRTMFLAMENYVYDRLRSAKQFTDDERSAINKFLGLVFNHECSGHVDTIYDVFVKPHFKERDDSLLSATEQVNPAYIPKPKVIECETFGDVIPLMYNKELWSKFDIIKCSFNDDCFSTASDPTSAVCGQDRSSTSAVCGQDRSGELVMYYSQLVGPITVEEFRKFEMSERWFIRNKDKLVPMPSYSQVRNASNYFINKFEEHRLLASLVFQQRPQHELLIHLHGVFDSIERADEYRVKESANIHDKVVVTPVGYSALGGDFRPNREGATIYNPSDPDIELMVNGRQNIRRAEARIMKKRTMSKLADRADPETMKAIRNFNKAKERLRSEGERKVREKYSSADQPEVIAEVRNAESLIDKKINDALQFLDDNELVFNTLKVKDGKMEKGEDYVVKF